MTLTQWDRDFFWLAALAAATGRPGARELAVMWWEDEARRRRGSVRPRT